jgi:hypothetical protein
MVGIVNSGSSPIDDGSTDSEVESDIDIDKHSIKVGDKWYKIEFFDSLGRLHMPPASQKASALYKTQQALNQQIELTSSPCKEIIIKKEQITYIPSAQNGQPTEQKTIALSTENKKIIADIFKNNTSSRLTPEKSIPKSTTSHTKIKNKKSQQGNQQYKKAKTHKADSPLFLRDAKVKEKDSIETDEEDYEILPLSYNSEEEVPFPLSLSSPMQSMQDQVSPPPKRAAPIPLIPPSHLALATPHQFGTGLGVKHPEPLTLSTTPKVAPFQPVEDDDDYNEDDFMDTNEGKEGFFPLTAPPFQNPLDNSQRPTQKPTPPSALKSTTSNSSRRGLGVSFSTTSKPPSSKAGTTSKSSTSSKAKPPTSPPKFQGSTSSIPVPGAASTSSALTSKTAKAKPIVEPTVAGIRNTGVSCFLNSMIQGIRGTPVEEAFLSISPETITGENTATKKEALIRLQRMIRGDFTDSPQEDSSNDINDFSEWFATSFHILENQSKNNPDNTLQQDDPIDAFYKILDYFKLDTEGNSFKDLCLIQGELTTSFTQEVTVSPLTIRAIAKIIKDPIIQDTNLLNQRSSIVKKIQKGHPEITLNEIKMVINEMNQHFIKVPDLIRIQEIKRLYKAVQESPDITKNILGTNNYELRKKLIKEIGPEFKGNLSFDLITTICYLPKKLIFKDNSSIILFSEPSWNKFVNKDEWETTEALSDRYIQQANSTTFERSVKETSQTINILPTQKEEDAVQDGLVVKGDSDSIRHCQKQLADGTLEMCGTRELTIATTYSKLPLTTTFRRDTKLTYTTKDYPKTTIQLNGQTYRLNTLYLKSGSERGGHWKVLKQTKEGEWKLLNDNHPIINIIPDIKGNLNFEQLFSGRGSCSGSAITSYSYVRVEPGTTS